MLKRTFFLSLLALTALLLFTQTSQAEARGHSRSNSVQLNVGAGYRNDTYVTRHYARPVVVAAPMHVYHGPVCYGGPCYAPVYAYPAPVVVEEVYVTRPPRPAFGFGGLSFSWNFFK